MSHASSLLENTLLADRYAICARLAESSNSVVFLAEDTTHGDRQCVIKQFASTQRGAYLRETAAAITLKSKYVLSPIDTFYLDESVQCLVYEYFPEGTLRDWINSHDGAINSSEIESCMRYMLGALDCLHSNKRIHCDIKPDNIFVRRSEGELAFLLGDLGATCSFREAQGGRHRTGSPAYTAPERLYDKFDAASDFYSLGVVCFELAVGQLPFLGAPVDIGRSHMNQSVPLERIADRRLRDFCGALLEKEPSQRISSVDTALGLLATTDTTVVSETRASDPGSTGVSIADEKQMILRREQMREVMRGTVAKGVKDFIAMKVNAKPMLLFDHGTHLNVFHPNRSISGGVIAKSGRVVAQSSRQIAYLVESRLMLLDLESGERTLIADCCPGALGFYIAGQRVAWRTRRSLHSLNLATRTESSELAVHYLMDPCLVVLRDGATCYTTGSMNNELILRRAEGPELRRIELDGPTVMLIADRSSVLAVTLDIGQRDRFSIWRASEYGVPKKESINAKVIQWAGSPGHLFWLDAEGLIHQICTGLSSRVVLDAGADVSRFTVSTDHSLLAVLKPDDDGRSRVTVYSCCPETAR